MRYAFPVAFSVLAFLGAAAITSDSSYIRIAATNSYVSANERFTIDVYVGAHKAVNAVDIRVSFPDDQIEIEGIDIGESVITIWTEEPYVDGNAVVIQGGTFRRGFEGEHLVAQINARAKESGVAKFSVGDAELLAGDGRGSSVSIKETGYESFTMYVDVDESEDSEITFAADVKVGIYTDIDGDGEVSMSDVLAFMNAWRNKTQKFDFNGDGKMTFVDFAIILSDSFFK